MDEKIWKWILDAQDDQALFNILNEGGIKIPGFRKLNRKVIMKFKLKIINESVKEENLLRICNLFNQMAELDPHQVRTQEKEMIKRSLHAEKLNPCQAFAFLLSSEEESHRTLAHELFTEINQEQLNGWVSKNDNSEDERQDNYLPRNKSSLEKKLEKSEAKNQILRKQLEEARTIHQQTRKDLDDVIRSLKQEHLKLKQEVGRYKNENQLLNEEIIKLEKTNNVLQERLEQKEKEYDFLSKRSKREENPKQLFNSDPSIIREIAMIGHPKNQMIVKSPAYDFQIYDSSDMQEEVGLDVFNRFDEIWLLTYRTPLELQVYIRRHIAEQKLLEFHNFIALRNHIRERVTP